MDKNSTCRMSFLELFAGLVLTRSSVSNADIDKLGQITWKVGGIRDALVDFCPIELGHVHQFSMSVANHSTESSAGETDESESGRHRNLIGSETSFPGHCTWYTHP